MPLTEDFWTLDGQKSFGHLPGLVLDRTDPVPICLQWGTKQWGARHIGHKHVPFITQNSVGAPARHEVPWVIWKKLQQSGSIWTAEQAGKLKVSLPLSPSSLLILQLNEDDEPFFSVTTLYTHSRGLDGQNIGRYVGRKWLPKVIPVFHLPP